MIDSAMLLRDRVWAPAARSNAFRVFVGSLKPRNASRSIMFNILAHRKQLDQPPLLALTGSPWLRVGTASPNAQRRTASGSNRRWPPIFVLGNFPAFAKAETLV